MGTFKDKIVDWQEKQKAKQIAEATTTYDSDIILEAAARIIADETLEGNHAAINDFEARIQGIVQGQTLWIPEVR
jgi:hypothetical protein